MSLAKNIMAGRDQRIADLAHSLWEEEGRPDGRAEQHWLRAAVLVDESTLDAAAKKPAAKAKAAAPKTRKK